MQVKDVMTPNVICIGANEPVLKAARLMLQNRTEMARIYSRARKARTRIHAQCGPKGRGDYDSRSTHDW
jgi:CBS domain-containing protein